MSYLDKLKSLCEKASPGPWETELEDIHKDGDVQVMGVYSREDEDGNRERIIVTDSGIYPPKLSDAAFIAEARVALPRLVGAVERLEKALETVMHQPFKGDWDVQAAFVSKALCEHREALAKAERILEGK